MVETELWAKQENGFSILMESHAFLHGEKCGSRYLVYLTRKETTHYPLEIWLLPYFIPMHPGFSSSYSLALDNKK
ncbi:hypothetical protein CK203_058435 [Vitis vinifera]|uniref:Uncharacterized protein n=1 Tax=Vitis vinifera TaxID=29760 RepID=A0A438H115_VITVI|nr:hypothetical protein CK203_058435 [Vitis vinifera]